MVKFLSGASINRNTIGVCTYWRSDVKANPDEDFATLEGTSVGFSDAREGGSALGNDPLNRALGSTGTSKGTCIANAFFKREDITCFNNGACDSQGQCLPCTKYRFEGMQIGISHSPPISFFRSFVKGVSEADLQSPNLIKAAGAAVLTVDQDQMPYNILLKNVMASIDKCCHWNSGDGSPSEFELRRILDGPDTKTITDVNGNQSNIKGITIKNSFFPDTVGTFIPIGTVVVAGFVDQPSFYLEPRTGLVKPGEGVIFSAGSSVSTRVAIKKSAVAATQPLIDSVNAAQAVCNDLNRTLSTDADFFNNAFNTNDAKTRASALAKLTETQTNQTTACTAAAGAGIQGNSANTLIGAIVQYPDASAFAGLSTFATSLAKDLDALATLVETAASAGQGSAAATHASFKAGNLRKISKNVRFNSAASVSKCEFFFEDNNIAALWNNPQDGTLICNGVRTDCDFYTGEEWKFATDPNLESGQPIKAETLQEIRFRSDDWARFSNPFAEFEKRFSVPFIWAFKQYVTVNFSPDPENLLLYRPKVLFGRDPSSGNAVDAYETMQIEKVKISDFNKLEFSKNKSLIQPGSSTLNRSSVPEFATKISRPNIPSAVKLEITHPPRTSTPFIYRMWSPDKNKITLFGTGTANRTVYIVNDTALRQRSRYNNFLGTNNFIDPLPNAVPGAPDFTTNGTTNAALRLKQQIFDPIEDEKRLNDSAAPLGFHISFTDNTGFWTSIEEVDLVHNTLNTIYIFILLDDNRFIVDSVKIDARFLHTIPVQTTFDATDFSMISTILSSKLGVATSDTVKKSFITATTKQTLGTEAVGFDHGYYAWRFKSRNLRLGLLNADNDLKAQNPIADRTSSLLATEAAAGTFITSVTYEVIQYRKEVEITEWYVINGCGFIMIKIPDTTAHRVLPMPDQVGNVKALSNILTNNGSRGSIIAQFALEKATLTINGEEKQLVQIFRNEDGFGLPANYIVLGPSTDSENAFGRPQFPRDNIKIIYTFLQAQSTGKDGGELPPQVVGADVVQRNFYGDNFHGDRTGSITFESNGDLTTGGEVIGDNPGGPFRREQQDYCYVFTDSEGRPIGRKIVRYMVMYYNLACISVEIFYNWSGDCQTYALIPDFNLGVGDDSGTLGIAPKGTTDPTDEGLLLGFRVANLIGDSTPCGRTPHCGDHELINLGPLRREFEVIVENNTTGASETAAAAGTSNQEVSLKANFPSAKGPITGKIFTSFPPGSQYRKRRGPLWYPYTVCERPRYDFTTNGPLGTDSTELINIEQTPAGVATGEQVPATGDINASSGVFGGLPRLDLEAYHGPDRVVPKILDIHPSLRICTSAFTYGNQVLKGSGSRFTGVARKRGEADLFWYEGLSWVFPPFGNFGRPRLQFEIAEKVGDFLGGDTGKQVGFRWMPMFPERLDMRGNLDTPFGEELEPVHIRLVATSTPAGGLVETINMSRKFTHKTLIQNIVGGGVEYPSIPYWPSFLPDDNIGQDPSTGGNTETLRGIITTQAAWREFETPIRRGVGGEILAGVRLQSPQYFIDNRRLEVRIRPSEGIHSVTWTPPEYDEAGALVKNASLKLDSGPIREIIIDFVNRNLNIAIQTNTVYDTSKNLGSDPFPCSENTHTDNPRLASLCSCSPETQTFETGQTVVLPARILHLDELRPDEGFVALYEDTILQTPFAIDLDRLSLLSPCCMCIYYIRGIFFALDLEFLPTSKRINAAYNPSTKFKYTWSRVPHGVATENGGQSGIDGIFAAEEGRANSYLDLELGRVFQNGFTTSFTQELNFNINELAAAFPSRVLTANLQEAGTLNVGGGENTDQSFIQFGGLKATNNISQGEEETIILDILFPTYVKISSITITFYVGTGWQVPNVRLGVIDPEFRVPGVPVPTLRTSRIIVESNVTTNGTSLSQGRNQVNKASFQAGLPQGVGAKFTVTLTPSYVNESFWNKFGQEFHLIFDQRSGPNSMGIGGIAVEVESMSDDITENVEIFERKYFTSTAIAAGGINPEEKLQAEDSATGYWRTTDQSTVKGGNKFRAYAWGNKLNDGDGVSNAPIKGDPENLEELQEKEYDVARGLMSSPYKYKFTGTIPEDESNLIQFYGGTIPTWTTILSMKLSSVDKVLTGGTGLPVFGVIPKDRKSWHAPGHTWTYKLESSFIFCCFPCPKSMVIDFEFAHLHDNLAIVETARFWDELPSGFSRLIRSTIMSPDVTFGQSQESGLGITGGTTGSAVLLSESLFNNVSVDTLENAGFAKTGNGDGFVLIQGGE